MKSSYLKNILLRINATNTKKPGDFCNKLIIIWKEDRKPIWSIDFVKKTGYVVSSVSAAIRKLKEISK